MQRLLTMRMKRIAAAVLIPLALAACVTTNPATGKKEFTPFMSAGQEGRIGAQEHPNILKQYGGQYGGSAVRAYVNGIGDRLARTSELPDLDFTFTVLDSPVVNAFALPGGYVYVSRGLLTLVNDEAELASVIGHEIGHVTGRHTAQRYNRAMGSQILGLGVGILTGSSELADLANQGSQLYLLSYSRGQELEADGFGIRYMGRSGYDRFGSVDMLTGLENSARLQQQITGSTADVPGLLRTHPYTSDRIKRAGSTLADAGVRRGDGTRGRDGHLHAIDGMLYGDDPKKGVVRGQEFLHPGLRLAFRAADGFRIQNSDNEVYIVNENARMIFAGETVSSGTATATALRQTWTKLTDGKSGPLQGVEEVATNGIRGLTGTARVTSGSGQIDVRLVALRMSDTQIYTFLCLTSGGGLATHDPAFKRTIFSFRRLSSGEAAGIKAQRIRIYSVRRGDTASSIAAQMDVDDYPLERFLTLNALNRQSILRVGDKVKVVSER